MSPTRIRFMAEYLEDLESINTRMTETFRILEPIFCRRPRPCSVKLTTLLVRDLMWFAPDPAATTGNPHGLGRFVRDTAQLAGWTGAASRLSPWPTTCTIRCGGRTQPLDLAESQLRRSLRVSRLCCQGAFSWGPHHTLCGYIFAREVRDQA